MLADVIDHIEYTRGIRTDGLTMSVYSALMVAATPVCNAIFSGILNASGYDQSADVALNTLGQSAAVNTAISVSYIWVETAAYALCAVLVFLWTVEKNLPAEQAAIVERKKGATHEVPAEHHQLPRFRHFRRSTSCPHAATLSLTPAAPLRTPWHRNRSAMHRRKSNA